MGWKDTIRDDDTPPESDSTVKPASSWKDTIRDAPPSYLATKAREFADATADALPALGGIAGGILGTPADLVAGPLGNVAGAAAGGMVGKAGQNLYNSYMRPELAPKTKTEYVTTPVTEGVTEGLLQGVGEGIPVAARMAGDTPVGRFIKNKAKSALGSVASFATGVDKDAVLRQLNRPVETASMEGEKAVYNLGKKAIQDVDATGKTLGENVGLARDQLIAGQGQNKIAQSSIDEIVSDAEKFLERHKPSQQGKSAITDEQRQELKNWIKDIQSGNVEDFVKAREQLDHVDQLVAKYGAESLSPFERQQLALRGQMNDVLKELDPRFKAANEAFSTFKDQKSILGLGNEGRAESTINNLYGANKVGRQEAAEALLKPENMELARDISANKAFDDIGPAGSPHGLRNMIKVAGILPTAGAIIPITSPKVWKYGLRQLGKFGPVLEEAERRGPQAFSATYSILKRTNPEFKAIADDIEAKIRGENQ